MPTITTTKTEQIVMHNRIDVDGQVCKHQEYTINSDDPENVTSASYFASDDAKTVYKDNRVDIRAIEAAFEDEVYAKVDMMVNKEVK